MVGMRQVQAVNLNLESASRLGRLALASWTYLFILSHLRFQRQTVLRYTPHFLATINSGSLSLISNFIAKALAFGRLGLTTVYGACFYVAMVVS